MTNYQINSIHLTKEQFGEKLTKYRKAADLIEASDLDYTIIRPAWLTFKNESDYEITQKVIPLKEQKFLEEV